MHATSQQERRMRRETRLAKGKGSGRSWSWRVIGDNSYLNDLETSASTCTYSTPYKYVCNINDNDGYKVKAGLIAVLVRCVGAPPRFTRQLS